MEMKKSQEYRNKIHKLIPGGAHTYSKGDDQFPSNAPAAIAYGKGAYVWDLDGNKFLDCTMGLSSVSLGHAYEPVLKRVRDELEKGVNFQRPSYLELEMAEKFLELIPAHQMIKFAKNGSSVTTAATKLARAYTGKKYIVFPQDHPFYSYDDWFIGKTMCNRGVPEEIQALSLTYKSTDLNTLEDLFKKYPDQIACVISEPEKSIDSMDFNLDDVIALTHRYGALFIQDEMVTGFKTGLPGSIVKNKHVPDMATWGKGIANGFSFCALTGIQDVMKIGGINEKGQERVFLISSTHGGETHSMAACLATIDEFKKHNVVSKTQAFGKQLIEQVGKILKEEMISDRILLSTKSWMPTFQFLTNGTADLKFRTFFLKQMFEKGVLFQGVFSPSFSHQSSDLDLFVSSFHNAIVESKKHFKNNDFKVTESEICFPVFRKFN